MRPASYKSSLLALFVPLFVSCSPMRPQIVELKEPGRRIYLRGYSLQPLEETGWMVAGRDDYRLGLAKQGEQRDETFAIQAGAYVIPPFDSVDRLVSMVKEGEEKDTDSRRFAIVRHEVVPYAGIGKECVWSNMVTEDHAAVKRSGQKGKMLLEATTLTCVHPQDRTVAVSIAFSQRCSPGAMTPGFAEKAATVISSVRLDKF